MSGRFPLIERPSPNRGKRPEGAVIDTLVLHYTGMASAAAALERLCDPAAQVSAHYMIDEDGTVYRLVPEELRAWHAGVSSWKGETDLNDRSIGIELVNPGHELGYRPFPEAQMESLIALTRGVLARHPIPPSRVLGHSDIAPGRKRDPGELFDWARLARAGIGLWPGNGESFAEGGWAESRVSVTIGAHAGSRPRSGRRRGKADEPDEPAGREEPRAPRGPWAGISIRQVVRAGTPLREVQEMLARFGYAVAASGRMDEPTRAALSAFQRHFRPRRVTGRPDGETLARLRRLLALSAA